jgi:hypothetical protein
MPHLIETHPTGALHKAVGSYDAAGLVLYPQRLRSALRCFIPTLSFMAPRISVEPSSFASGAEKAQSSRAGQRPESR